MLRRESAAPAGGADLMENVTSPFNIRAGRAGRDCAEKWCIADERDPCKLVDASKRSSASSSTSRVRMGLITGDCRVVLPSFETSTLLTS